MAEIVNVYTQEMPAMRFIGKKYGDADRVNGGFGEQWGEWHRSGRFAALEQYIAEAPERRIDVEDGDAWIGLMRWKEGEPFQYWIGRFAAAGTDVMDGCEAVDLPKGKVGICWLKGREPDIYGKEMECGKRLIEEGLTIVTDDQQADWFFERYAHDRFKPDGDGDTIVDIGHFIR